MLPSVSQMEQYIRSAAAQRGINPDIAVRVAKSEGLAPGVWQSNIVKNGKREPSYGPFQLYTGGGLGNQFVSQTGLDPSDPGTWQKQVDFALNTAKTTGWSPWYGSKAVGIGPWQGIKDGAPTDNTVTASISPSQSPFPMGPMVASSGNQASGFHFNGTPEEANAINETLFGKEKKQSPFQALLKGIAEGIPNPSPPRPGRFPGGPSSEQANGLLKAVMAGPALANLLMSKRV